MDRLLCTENDSYKLVNNRIVDINIEESFGTMIVCLATENGSVFIGKSNASNQVLVCVFSNQSGRFVELGRQDFVPFVISNVQPEYDNGPWICKILEQCHKRDILKCLCKPDRWIIQDRSNKIYLFNVQEFQYFKSENFHLLSD